MGRTHPNVLKARKQRRMGRRAYLTSQYSLIHVPRSIGKSDIPEDAQPLFDYRSRGKSVYDPWLEAIFPGVKPKPSDWNAESVEKFTKPDGTAIPVNAGERNGRKFALERAEQERLLEFVEHEDVCDFHTVKDSPLQSKRLTIVFNRKKTCVYFIQIDYHAQEVRRSKTYGSYERALFDAEHNRISWHHFLVLESLTLVLPRRR